MSDLKSILGKNKKEITLQGKKIVISPILVGNLASVVEHKELISQIFNGNVLELISGNFDEVLKLMCSICNLEEKLIKQLELHEFIDLIETVVEVNKEGFFLTVEKFTKLTKEMTKSQENLNGQKRSNSSSKKATTQKESRVTQ